MKMNMVKILTILALVMPGWFVPTGGGIGMAATGSLVLNGDFETVVTDSSGKWTGGKAPANWTGGFKVGGGAFAVDSTQAHGGTKALKLSGGTTSDRASVTQSPLVTPNKSYKLSLWMKTDNVNAGSGGMYVRTQYLYYNGSTNTKIGDGPLTPKLKGTNDWQPYDLYLTIPSNVNKVVVEPIFDFASGTAWVDDVTLTEWTGATGLALEPTGVSVEVGKTAQLTPVITPGSAASGVTVLWSSSDASVASVSASGLVTGNRVGSATITARTDDGRLSAQSIVSVESAQMMQAYDTIRLKWLDKLTGGTGYDPADADYAYFLNNLASSVSNAEQTGFWNKLNTAAGRTYLWSDLASTTVSAQMTSNFSRLRTMAVAYKTPYSALYNNPALKKDLVEAMDWMYANRYNENKTPYDNWWDWEIGAAQTVNDILVLLYDDLTPAQVEQYIRAIDKFCPDPVYSSVLGVKGKKQNGANLLDKALVVTLRGVIGKNGAKIVQGRDAIGSEFVYTTSGDGVYRDGSLVQHTNIAYTAGYGGVWLKGAADMGYMLNGSPWPITDPRTNNVYDWVAQSFEPIIYNGLALDMTNGRGISRQTAGSARGLMMTILRMSDGAPADKAAAYRSMVKEWITKDRITTNYYQASSSIYEIKLLKGLLNDPSVQPRGELVKSQIMAGMDKVFHFRPGYLFGVSLFSDRISSFEKGNGENLKGWFTGVGMTYLYNEDQTQYRNDFWPTVDSFRLPGTTTDGSGKTLTATDWASYPNTQTWVGGSMMDGLYSAVGMDFTLKKLTGSDLGGKKSWFLLDDEIVALGAGITSTGSNPVETIADNRKLTDGNDNILTIDGTVVPKETTDLNRTVRWAHLTGNVPGTDIGYYFPNGANVAVKREARTGAWKDINTGFSSTPITRNYLSLAFAHGVKPVNADYAYVLLPNRNAAATQSYSAQPPVSILANNAQVQAVRKPSLGITAANFWQAGTVDGLTARNPASVMVKERNGEITLSVSDPTQKQASVTVELNRGSLVPVSQDSTVQVVQTSPTLIVQVNVSGSAGATHTIKLRDPLVPHWEGGALQAAGVSETGVSLAWSGAVTSTVADATYRIYQNGTPIASVSGSTYGYDVRQLAPGTIYTFAVQVADAGGRVSTDGPSVTVTTLRTERPDTAAPTWPFGSTLTAAEVTSGEVRLAWTPAADDNGVAGYRVGWGAGQSAAVAGSVYSTVIRGLAPNTAYTFRVEAVDGAGNWSAGGPSVTVTTAGLAPEKPGPGPDPGPKPEPGPTPEPGPGPLPEPGPGPKPSPEPDSGSDSESGSDSGSSTPGASPGSAPQPGASGSAAAGSNDPSKKSGTVVVKEEELRRAADGKVTLRMDEAAAELALPAQAASLLRNNPLEVEIGKAALTIPAAVLEQVSGSLPADTADARIMLRVRPAAEQALTPDAAKPGPLSELRLAGTVYELQISAVVQTKPVSRLEKFSAPVVLKLPYDAARASDPDRLGIYAYNETSKTWDFVGAKVDKAAGTVSAAVTACCTFAVLDYDKSFADVPEDHWAHRTLKVMASKHIVSGVTEHEFNPQGATTRAEFAAMLVRALGLKASPSGTPFRDVEPKAWYADAIAAVHEAGVVDGVTGTSFAPGEPVTREQMAVMLMRAYAFQGGKAAEPDAQQLAAYRDAGQISAWAEDAVRQAVKLGFLQGQAEDRLAPQVHAARAEVAQVLLHMITAADARGE
ncbi:polysaccharide lyase family 8 super-sandwich domain-containing protein [Paenibacillus ehimensis]|uniref:polysaccharide lyase family 8 super-sandwich domain-containing protein n=1 Tax=Paenibacillus ehimensis TaxID=79264 RepID=UPI0004717741|nr:polysaccharide lyase family 8 super-sandwich domain-containing protein [Paenibacillus ehimensis]